MTLSPFDKSLLDGFSTKPTHSMPGTLGLEKIGLSISNSLNNASL